MDKSIIFTPEKCKSEYKQKDKVFISDHTQSTQSEMKKKEKLTKELKISNFLENKPSLKPKISVEFIKKEFENEFKEEKLESNYKNIDVCNSLIQFLTLILTIIAFMLLAYTISLYLESPRFCNDENTQNCLSCPDHGVCSNRDLICDYPFVKIHNNCVDDTVITIETYDSLIRLETYFSNKFSSEYRKTRDFYKLSLKEYFYLFPNSDTIQNNIKKLLSYDESRILKLETKDGIDFLSLRHFKLNFLDRIIVFLQNYVIFFVLGLIIAALIRLYLANTKSQKETEQKSKIIYDIIRTQVKHNCDFSIDNGVYESMIRSIMIQFIGKKLSDNMWPKVKHHLMSDKNVKNREVNFKRRLDVL